MFTLVSNFVIFIFDTVMHIQKKPKIFLIKLYVSYIHTYNHAYILSSGVIQLTYTVSYHFSKRQQHITFSHSQLKILFFT